MKWVLVALVAILIAEILWLTWPEQNKGLLVRPYASDAFLADTPRPKISGYP